MIPFDFLVLHVESDPVTNLSASGMSSGTVFAVQWSKPDRPNGNITHYVIEIYNIGDSCSMELEMITRNRVEAPSDDHTTINTVIRNLGNVLYNYQTVLCLDNVSLILAPGRPYRVRVRAVNSVTESEDESVCNFTQQQGKCL